MPLPPMHWKETPPVTAQNGNERLQSPSQPGLLPGLPGYSPWSSPALVYALLPTLVCVCWGAGGWLKFFHIIYFNPILFPP